MSKELLISQIKNNYDLICKAKKEVADLKEKKAVKKSASWDVAEGSTAKAKEDFVRAQVADIEKEIDYKNANIELMENMIEIWYTELVYIEDE